MGDKESDEDILNLAKSDKNPAAPYGTATPIDMGLLEKVTTSETGTTEEVTGTTEEVKGATAASGTGTGSGTGSETTVPAAVTGTTAGPPKTEVPVKEALTATALSNTKELYIESMGNGTYKIVSGKGDNVYKMARTNEGECFTLSNNQSGGKATRRNKKKKRGLKSRAKRRY